MKNYEFISEKYIDEIDSMVRIYKHIKSGAKICTMKNTDSNKVFSIAFRTPAINNTGLTHILEHSVLCGSKNYPVKDPFVELLKGSLNTFLNAFTFPDKTMYPVASINMKDFKNLMGVYLDAVFYPNIYSHEEIFLQEGWHYEIEKEEDPITLNGVVYNEMKGAFSDPSSILGRLIMHSLYPDTTYGYESGGDPKYIPDLSYEEFKDFHSKYYSPSNSYIYLYGDMDMEERLEWLDSEYLSKFDIVDFDTTIKYQAPFNKPVYLTDYYEAQGDTKNKTFLSYNTVMPSVTNTKDVLGMSILVNALFNIPGAPLKEAIEDLKIGEDVSCYLESEVIQPFMSIELMGSNKESEELFISTIENTLKDILKNGLDKNAILSIINHNEFENRERMFSSRMPKGLIIEIAALASWLYDDNMPFASLEVLKYFKEFKDDLENGYFESLIEKYILNNNHKTFVSLIPKNDLLKDENIKLAKKLEEYKNSLSHDELISLINKNKRLKEYQSEESTEEELNTLPKLSIEDINKEPQVYNLEVKDNKYKTLFSDYHTNEIVYTTLYFDISHIKPETLLTLSLYSDLFKELDTKNYSYFELNNIIRDKLGKISINIVPYVVDDTCEAKCNIIFSLSAIKDNIKLALDLLSELINNVSFEAKDKIYARIAEIKNNVEMRMSGSGHNISLTRAASFIKEDAYFNDLLSGIGYFDYINDLYDNFDQKYEDLKKELYNAKNVFAKSNLVIGFTGNNELYNDTIGIINEFVDKLNDNHEYETFKFEKNPKLEAIIAPYNVNYVARVFESDYYNGSINVLNNALSLDYLWQEVRVHGGAYGCFLRVYPNIALGFTSYRDPNVDRTNDVYNNTYKFIDDMKYSSEDMLKFIIGAIGSTQDVSHVSQMAASARGNYFTNMTYEKRTNNRIKLINTTLDDMKLFKDEFKKINDSNIGCVLGNEKAIKESKIKFDVVRNLTK